MGMGDLPTEAVEEAQGWGCHGPLPLQVRGPFAVRQPRALRPRKQAVWPNLQGARRLHDHPTCTVQISPFYILHESPPHITNHALLAYIIVTLLSRNFLEKKEWGLLKDRDNSKDLLRSIMHEIPAQWRLEVPCLITL